MSEQAEITSSEVSAETGSQGVQESVGNSVSISVPTDGGGSGRVFREDTFAAGIPEAYKDKPYIQELLKTENPKEELYKRFDGLYKKLGERAQAVPGSDASDEDWDKFYENTRPKEKTEYAVPDLNLGEGKEDIQNKLVEGRDQAFIDRFRDVAYKNGLTPKQFSAFASEYEKATADSIGAHFLAQQQIEKDFMTEATKQHGGDRDKALERGRTFLKDMIPEKLQAYFQNASNETLLAVTAIEQGVRNKYVKEDTTDTRGAAASGIKTEADLNAEQRELLASPAIRGGAFHRDYDSTMARVKGITQQIMELRRKK